MIKEKYKTYVHWGITVFLIVLGSMLAFFFILRVEETKRTLATISAIFAPIVTGMVLAYLLAPIADTFIRGMGRLHKHQGPKVQKLYRGLSVLFSICLLIAVIAFMIGTLIPQVIDTLKTLIGNIDAYIQTMEAWLQPITEVNPTLHDSVIKAIEGTELQVKNFMENDLMTLLGTVTSGVVEVGKMIYNFVIGMIVSIYVLAAREKLFGRFKKAVYAWLNLHRANQVLEVVRQTDAMFRGFIVGKVVDSSIIGVLCFLGMTLLKLPYPMFISVIVGVTNIIPYFGPFLGAIPCGLLILIIDPTKALIFGVFILILQQLDGNFIGPKVLGNTTGLSSLGVLFSILVGGGLFGITGMILSVPTVGVVYSILKKLSERRLQRRNLPVDSADYVTLEGIDEVTLKPARAVGDGSSARAR
ncbi:MAG: AI-2E family transporter [Clostridia bacterium]